MTTAETEVRFAVPAAQSESYRRAHALYEEQIGHRIAPADREKYLLIDLESGDFEVGEDDIAIEEPLLQRHPNARMYLMRADGGPAGSLGSSWL